MSDQKHSAMLDKIQNLLNLADHPNTPPEEADSARAMAEKLMVKFAIEEHMLAGAGSNKSYKPASEKIEFSEWGNPSGTRGNPLVAEYYFLLCAIAQHNRVMVAGTYSGEATLVGYESDIWITKIMYAQVRMHLSHMTNPQPDIEFGYDQNIYNLHSAGLNWREICFRMNKAVDVEQGDDYESPWDHTPWPDGGRLIRAAKRWAKEINEPFESKMQPKAYRKNFATAYVNEIERRLRKMRIAREGEVTQEGTLVLADRSASVKIMYDELFPPKSFSYAKVAQTRYDHKARSAGANAAATADLSGAQGKAGSGARKEIG